MSAPICVIDASVLAARVVAGEPAYRDVRNLFNVLADRHTPLFVPAIALAEVAAALSRGAENAALAVSAAVELRRLPNLLIIPIDGSLGYNAAIVAAQWRIRGSDAVYGALAQALEATLITLDSRQRERVPETLPALTPAEFLSQFT